MSVYQHYRELGYSPVAPQTRNISNATLATVTIWTPTSGMRIAATNLQVSANASGTIVFLFAGDNNQKLAEFSIAGSVTISPYIECWESTAKNAQLVCNFSTGASNQWQVSVGGFELE